MYEDYIKVISKLSLESKIFNSCKLIIFTKLIFSLQFILYGPFTINGYLKPLTIVEIHSHNFSHSDSCYLEHEKIRDKCMPITMYSLSKQDYVQLKQSYSVSSYALGVAAKINNNAEVLSFLNSYNNKQNAFELAINRTTIDKLIPILYTSNGYPKQQLNSYEKYQVARIVTDYYKDCFS